MGKKFLSELRSAFIGSGHVWYHISLVSLSAGIAMSLPYLAQGFLNYWALVKNEKVFLISAEIGVAIFLMVFFNHLSRSFQDRKLAKAASGTGLVQFFPGGERMAQKRVKHLIQEHGFPRHVLIMGSTGGTFVDTQGDLHEVLRHCFEAKIMLLNPYSENARIRATSILHPDINLESLKAQARTSVDFLKLLRAAQKKVSLKFYSYDPNVKMAILGDHVWLQHYHTNLDVQTMPMYAFKFNPKDHGLYTIFYQHFVEKWEQTDTPEYDLETDELVYKGSNGREVRREKFLWDTEPQPRKANLFTPEAPAILKSMDRLPVIG